MGSLVRWLLALLRAQLTRSCLQQLSKKIYHLMRTCHGRSLFKQNINQRRNVETGLKLTSKPIKIHREYWLFPARVTKMTDILSQLTIHNTPELAKSSDPASAQSPVTKYRTKYIFSPSNKNGNRALRNNNTLSCPIKRERPCWMMKIYSLYMLYKTIHWMSSESLPNLCISER